MSYLHIVVMDEHTKRNEVPDVQEPNVLAILIQHRGRQDVVVQQLLEAMDHLLCRFQDNHLAFGEADGVYCGGVEQLFQLLCHLYCNKTKEKRRGVVMKGW